MAPTDFIDDREEFACDCVASLLYEALPGTPGRHAGLVPYSAFYDTKEEARRRGYWIPGVPVVARITEVKRDQKFGLHIINAYLYTVELEHGPFRWTVVKRNKDFTLLAARLLTHRAAERIRAPVRRAQEVLDDALEPFGIDILSDHKVTCPNHRKKSTSEEYSLERSEELKSSVWQSAKLSELNGSNSYQHSIGPHSSFEHEQNSEVERNRVVLKIPVRSEIASPKDVISLTNEEVTPIKEEISERAKKLDEVPRHQLPSFGFVPDAVSDPSERRERLEKWLKAVLHIPVNRNHHETAEFLEVSRYSFINELGGKYCEGFVKKRPGGGRVFIGWKQFCVRYCVPWSKRWLILKDSSVCYMDARSEQIRFVLLFDRDFGVSAGSDETEGMKSGLVITNQQHELALKCVSPLEAKEWKNAILESMNGVGKIWCEPHPYGSTFPVRRSQSVRWFVDARKYMEHAANMMELAREEIFIADWWLSPEIFLKRPLVEGTKWRLDQLLKRKAEEGVRIFVLLYKEMEMALGINSIYTKKKLQKLHQNIKVLRHPDHYLSSGTFFWAHHEKLVIVDQLIAFVGGVDLCYGRWDDVRHKLDDLGSVKFDARHVIAGSGEHSVVVGIRSLAAASGTLSPIGLEAAEQIKGCQDPALGFDEVDVKEVPAEVCANKSAEKWKIFSKGAKVSKHDDELSQGNDDVTDATVVNTMSGNEERGHSGLLSFIKHTPSFRKPRTDAPPIEMFNLNAENMDIRDAITKYKEFVQSGKAEVAKRRAERSEPHPPNVLSRVASNFRPTAKKRWQKVKEETGRYDISYLKLCGEDEKINALEEEIEGAGKLWVGKDYVNFIHKDFVDLDMPFHDFIDRGLTPRMPWHDIHSVVYGSAARDLARHFIQRWNATKTEKSKELKEYPFLLPKCYDSVKVPLILANSSSRVDVQVLRSVSKWSSLINRTEDSIQQAYLSLIANARHCIYIENQFFVSLIDSNEVCNEICQVLCDRIKRAYRENETFRVYILLPLLPGFEGDIGAPGGSALQAVLHWTFLSLSRGPNSLIENLKRVMPDPMKYIHVGSLRTYGFLCGRLITELIYIHSKLIIVDDKYVVIGSANINDRSQAGNRDSEVCILIKDCEFTNSKMDGKPYQAGKFARGLRKHLMKEHLCILPEQKANYSSLKIDLNDPISELFFEKTWKGIARSNTEIYEEVFRVIPTNSVETFEELKEWSGQMPMSEYTPQLAEEKLRRVLGSIVDFPMNFLLKANLAPGFASKEGLVPSSVFT